MINVDFLSFHSRMDIVILADASYIRPLAVTLYSLLESHKGGSEISFN
jgi:lipopolysaccharide biosynthesis glycosyltransferase